MQPKQEKTLPNVVNIDSNEDEGEIRVGNGNTLSSNKQPVQNRPNVNDNVTIPPPSSTSLEARSFWKAGAYDIGPTKWTPAEGQLEHARVHPKFLHSNATSHKWAFGAIAELLDNAVDEISHGATFVKVDRIYNKKDNSPALLFLDDGGGMDPDCVRKCMSLGYSSKKTNTTIGQYGNGFKTSTMRLGADAIVFSRSSGKSRATQTVGLLSYTFLRRTGQDDVIVPMVDFDVSNHWAEPIIYSSQEEWSSNLNTILEWSPFSSKHDLMQQFEDIGSHGTKIIIFNLWLNEEGIFELNFDDDEGDIKLRDEASFAGLAKTKRTQELQSHISYRMRFSLRAYASMLYLRKFTNFKIILRGTPVEQFNIADELLHRKLITYKPQLATTSKEVVAEATLGFIKEAPQLGVSGFNIYHKNRLIRPFWKVTSEGTSRGNGVIGVLEANFIEPAHDKQDFERSSVFYRLEGRLKQMIMDYWKGHYHLIVHQNGDANLHNMQKAATQSANAPKEMHLNQPPIKSRVANNRQDLSGAQPGLVQEVACVDNTRPTSVDQICEENIQLFMRCDTHKQKENELRKTIAELEQQVEETKRKCAYLSLQLQSRRKQKLV